MTLSEGKVGCTYKVLKIDLDAQTERRLEALGLTEGTNIELLNQKRKGTSIFSVRGTRLAVGPAIALGIFVDGGEIQ